MSTQSISSSRHDRLHKIWHVRAYARAPRPWLLAGLTLVAIALVIAGSVGPWLTIERGPEWAIEIERLRGFNTDGVFSLFFAAIASALLLVALIRPDLWVFAAGAFVALLFCTMVGLFDWVLFEPMDLAADQGRQISAVRVEWGLKLLTAAAPVAALCSILFARALERGDY
jgi:hypothetical protein